MRKIYSKPEIMYEDFTLSVNIAGTCEVKTDTPSRGQCGLPFGPEIIFLTGMTGCTDQYAEEQYDGICYHVPNANNNLFNS